MTSCLLEVTDIVHQNTELHTIIVVFDRYVMICDEPVDVGNEGCPDLHSVPKIRI